MTKKEKAANKRLNEIRERVDGHPGCLDTPPYGPLQVFEHPESQGWAFAPKDLPRGTATGYIAIGMKETDARFYAEAADDIRWLVSRLLCIEKPLKRGMG